MSGHVELELHIHHTGDRFIVASDDGDREHAVTLPLSQIEVAPRRGAVAEVSMPQWLAEERGLV